MQEHDCNSDFVTVVYVKMANHIATRIENFDVEATTGILDDFALGLDALGPMDDGAVAGAAPV